MTSTIALCPICQSSKLTCFLKRKNVPVHQNLIMEDQNAALNVIRGNLDMVVCNTCGFVFNQSFDPSRLSYGDSYDNTQTCSSYFLSYINELVYYLIEARGIKNKKIVEVGCGKGEFVKAMIGYSDSGNVGYGFDPSYQGPIEQFDGRLIYIKSFYGEEYKGIKADVIICRHVIEHTMQPLNLLHTIRQALNKSCKAQLFLETPCVEWILRNKVVSDLFYEHCSLFTVNSLTVALSNAGFIVDDARHVFNGQYLWLEASVASVRSDCSLNPHLIPTLAYEFGITENKVKNEWIDKIKELSVRGKVALWGAGAKGVTFANLVDPNRKLIDCIVDLNPKKQKRYVPGTGHPIVGYMELPTRGVKDVILMNPNYRDENMSLIQKAEIDVNLLG